MNIEKEVVVGNFYRIGGFVGVLGYIACFAMAIVPPWVVITIMDVQAVLIRLAIPLVWNLYLMPGSLMLPERMRPVDALRLAVWPMIKS